MRHSTRIALMLALSILCEAVAWADNPYQIDDYLYGMYQRAQKVRSTKQCLAIADSMRTEAIRLGDLKGECLALTNHVGYWYGARDTLRTREAVDLLKDVSRRNGYLQYYYYGANTYATLIMIKGEATKAMKLLDQMKIDALKDDYPYGIYQCYVGTANLFQMTGSLMMALNYYQKAIRYNIEHELNQPMSAPFTSSCNIARRFSDFEGMLRYADEGLQDKNLSGRSRIALLDYKATALFFLDRTEEFEQVCDDMEALVKEYGSNTDNSLTDVLLDLHNGRLQQALDGIEKYETNKARHYVAAVIYGRMGRYADQLKEMKFCTESLRDRDKVSLAQDLVQMGSDLENVTLSADLAEEQLESQRLSLRQAHMLSDAIMGAIVIIILAAVLLIFYTSRKRIRNRELSEQERYDFLMHLGHELNTPLTIVTGSLRRVAKGETLDETQRDKLNKAYRQTERLHYLLDTMEVATSVQSGSFKSLNREPVDVARWVETSALAYADEIKSLGSELSVKSTPEIMRAQIDKRRLQIVFINLMTNAIRHLDKGTEIKVRTSRASDGRKAHVAISGRSSSLNEDFIHAFDQDYNQEGAKSDSFFGLMYSKPIIEAHGGEIGLDTDLSAHKLSFWFELPIIWDINS